MLLCWVHIPKGNSHLYGLSSGILSFVRSGMRSTGYLQTRLGKEMGNSDTYRTWLGVAKQFKKPAKRINIYRVVFLDPKYLQSSYKGNSALP